MKSVTKNQSKKKRRLRYAIVAGLTISCVIASVVSLKRGRGIVVEKADSSVALPPALSLSATSTDSTNHRFHPLLAKSQAAAREESDRGARRRAREIVGCIEQSRLRTGAENLLERSAGESSPELKQLYDEKFERLQAKLTAQSSRDCKEFESKSLSQMVYPALLAAAESGDQDAASCYAAAKFELSPGQMRPSEVDSYRTHALAFIEEGVARGDWRFVDLAASASGTFFHKYSDWFGQLMPQSDETQYRYLKLEEFGADGEFAESLRGRLIALRDKLSASAIERGDKWADVQFEAHFTRSGRLSSVPQLCEMPVSN